MLEGEGTHAKNTKIELKFMQANVKRNKKIFTKEASVIKEIIAS